MEGGVLDFVSIESIVTWEIRRTLLENSKRIKNSFLVDIRSSHIVNSHLRPRLDGPKFKVETMSGTLKPVQ